MHIDNCELIVICYSCTIWYHPICNSTLFIYSFICSGFPCSKPSDSLGVHHYLLKMFPRLSSALTPLTSSTGNRVCKKTASLCNPVLTDIQHRFTVQLLQLFTVAFGIYFENDDLWQHIACFFLTLFTCNCLLVLHCFGSHCS